MSIVLQLDENCEVADGAGGGRCKEALQMKSFAEETGKAACLEGTRSPDNSR